MADLRVLVATGLVCLAGCADRTGVVLAGASNGAACGVQLGGDGVAFCERFDEPAPAGGRSGALEGARWSVARLSGVDAPGQANGWSPTSLVSCDGTHAVSADDGDVVVCDGQLREASTDHGGPTVLAMSMKQPFDFAGRTGTIAFDVTNDTSGKHGTWPVLWLTDDPVPAPDAVNSPCGICSLPRHGLALNFSGNFAPHMGGQVANCPDDEHPRWIVASALVVRDFAVETRDYAVQPGSLQVQGCVISSSGPDGAPNHVEVRVSAGRVEVWASDPGSRELKALALVPDAGLSFTRGFVTLEDKHFDAAQSPAPATATHTYTWSNVAFDGPTLPAVRSYDVPDALTALPDGTLALGWATAPTSPVTLSTPPISAVDLAAATGALVVFNVGRGPLTAFQLTVNGTAATAPSPFAPDATLWHSVALPVPLASLRAGRQSLVLAGDQPTDVANVSVVLVR